MARRRRRAVHGVDTGMILERDMVQAALLETGIHWMNAATADDVVARFRSSRRSLMALDGFMGAGKSPFGSMMEWRLGQRCLRMDRYLPKQPDLKQPSLIGRLDLTELRHDLATDLKASTALIEGVLMRDLLDRLEVLWPAQVFHVYVAGAWKPDDTRVTWPDANQLGSEQGYEPQRQIVDYHQRQCPHERFDVAVLRDQDELGRSGIVTAPDGQRFEISEAVWPRARLPQLRVNRWAYVSSNAEAQEIPIGLIRAPALGVGASLLEDTQLAQTLKQIHAQIPLPPVRVEIEPATGRIRLVEGTYRFFASVAIGMMFIPAVIQSAQMHPGSAPEVLA